jgi:hypothetical protein
LKEEKLTMKIEHNEPMPQLQIALRQASPTASRLPAAVGADSNPKAGNLTETAAGSNRLVETLAGSRIFREYQRAFAEATGLSSIPVSGGWPAGA